MSVRLLLVDDDPLVRAGLAAMLGGTAELELVLGRLVMVGKRF